MTTTFTQIESYFVGNDEYMLRIFAYPQHNEVDFEIYTVNGEYVTTITSNRPELSTSVVWKFLKGIPTDCITYIGKE